MTALCIALFALAMLSSTALALDANKFGIGGRLGYAAGVTKALWTTTVRP